VILILLYVMFVMCIIVTLFNEPEQHLSPQCTTLPLSQRRPVRQRQKILFFRKKKYKIEEWGQIVSSCIINDAFAQLEVLEG